MCRVRACVDTEMACRHCKCKCRASATVGSVAAQVHFLSKYCVARGIREPDADFFAECIRIINIFAMVLPMSLLFPVCVLLLCDSVKQRSVWWIAGGRTPMGTLGGSTGRSVPSRL